MSGRKRRSRTCGSSSRSSSTRRLFPAGAGRIDDSGLRRVEQGGRLAVRPRRGCASARGWQPQWADPPIARANARSRAGPGQDRRPSPRRRGRGARPRCGFAERLLDRGQTHAGQGPAGLVLDGRLDLDLLVVKINGELPVVFLRQGDRIRRAADAAVPANANACESVRVDLDQAVRAQIRGTRARSRSSPASARGTEAGV